MPPKLSKSAARPNWIFYVSTSAEDTDFFVLLVDVDNNGGKRALTHSGTIRMRYLSDWEKPIALEPNRIDRVKINLGAVAHLFEKGQSYRAGNSQRVVSVVREESEHGGIYQRRNANCSCNANNLLRLGATEHSAVEVVAAELNSD